MECFQKLRSGNMDEIRQAIVELQKHDGPDKNLVVKELYDLIWNTAGFKQQVVLIEFIIEQIEENIHKELLQLVIARFKEIRTDRRDKFYYFIEKSMKLLSFNEILNISDSDVLEHFCRCLNRFKPADWNDGVFLEFLSTCRPWLCGLFTDIKIDKEMVKPYLTKSMGHENRTAMYRLMEG